MYICINKTCAKYRQNVTYIENERDRDITNGVALVWESEIEIVRRGKEWITSECIHICISKTCAKQRRNITYVESERDRDVTNGITNMCEREIDIVWGVKENVYMYASAVMKE